MELSLAYMSISFEKLRATLKQYGVPVTRDKAEKERTIHISCIPMLAKGKKI